MNRLGQFVVTFAVLLGVAYAQDPQPAPLRLNLIVVEGDGAINNLKQRTARQTIVQVEDENHKPVAGVVLSFTLPADGPGGVFAGGAHNMVLTTGANGRALVTYQPNQ